jgi:hypothetical protein
MHLSLTTRIAVLAVTAAAGVAGHAATSLAADQSDPVGRYVCVLGDQYCYDVSGGSVGYGMNSGTATSTSPQPSGGGDGGTSTTAGGGTSGAPDAGTSGSTNGTSGSPDAGTPDNRSAWQRFLDRVHGKISGRVGGAGGSIDIEF